MARVAVTLPPLNAKEVSVLQSPVPQDSRPHVQQARATYRRAYVKWSALEDATLRRLFQDGHPSQVIAQVLERNLSGIEARTKKLGLTVIKPPKPAPVNAASPAKTPAKPRVQATPVPRAVQPAASSQVCLYCVTPIPSGATNCPNCGAATAHAPSHRLSVGTTLQGGRYSVGKIVGEGGFGITYMGANIAQRQRVAIKEYYPQGATRNGKLVTPPRGINAHEFATERRKCLEEAARLARFHHAGIVQVNDAFEENGTVYIVMEFLGGESLESRVRRRGALEPLEVRAMAEQLLGALEQIHAANILHRDIKPDNVMLCDQPARAVLIDFGAAREFQTQRTQMHSLILTPGYAPLEQYGSNLRRHPSSDLYALAGTLYYALTAQPPPPATERVQGVNLKTLPESVVKQALGLAEAITAALSIRVDQRPQSAREMLERIRWTPRPSSAVAAADAPAWLERLLKVLKGR
jgi:hypothetical protein